MSDYFVRIQDRQATIIQKMQATSFRHKFEWSLQLAVGLTIHNAMHSKKILDFLHGILLYVDYSRVIHLETQLANAVINKMKNDEVYVPPMMVQGYFVYFQ